MARPSRSKKTTAKKPPAKPTTAEEVRNEPDPSIEEQALADAAAAAGDDDDDDDDSAAVEMDEREKELEELRAELARREKANAQLKADLKKSNEQVAASSISNDDFREKPPPGKYFYYLVRFDPKRNEGDTEMVMAAVNGDWMNWQRGVETVLRSDYKEALENACTAKFTVLPGQDRKEVGSLQTYTFNILKKITKAEYEKRVREGNAKLRQSIAG